LGSVAPSLILAGIPSVIAMQQRLSDEAAGRFSRGFYQALLAGQDIESAVVAGRKQLIRTDFWHVPTLYLRTRKQPEITQAYLERRIDTAGPKRAPLNKPLRFGLWIRRTDSPKPDDEDLRRLLGLEPDQAITRDSMPARVRFPVDVREIKPGLVDVHVIAPDCDFHTSATKQVSVFPDFDTPPLWFCFTPRRAGRLDVIFELTQDGGFIASVAHTITITESAEGLLIASVKSHESGEGDSEKLDDVIQAPIGTPAPPLPPSSSGRRQETEPDILGEIHEWVENSKKSGTLLPIPPSLEDQIRSLDEEKTNEIREYLEEVILEQRLPMSPSDWESDYNHQDPNSEIPTLPAAQPLPEPKPVVPPAPPAPPPSTGTPQEIPAPKPVPAEPARPRRREASETPPAPQQAPPPPAAPGYGPPPSYDYLDDERPRRGVPDGGSKQHNGGYLSDKQSRLTISIITILALALLVCLLIVGAIVLLRALL
jgi:hypothetical protein